MFRPFKKQKAFQHKTNFTDLINGYARRIKPHFPSAVIQIILLYHPKMNGHRFQWKLDDTKSLGPTTDSDAFDLGLQNFFFLRLKRISSEGEPVANILRNGNTNNTNNKTSTPMQILLMSFPMPTNVRSVVFHCQLHCEELNEQYCKIFTVVSSNRNRTANPFEIPSISWCIAPTHSLDIECTLNVLQIRATQDNVVDLSAYNIYRPLRSTNNQTQLGNGVVLYNYHVTGHNNDNMKFEWNLTNRRTVIEFQRPSAYQIVSGIYHDMFQFVANKSAGSISPTSPISFGVYICGVPHGANTIGVKLEVSYYNAAKQEIVNIVSKIHSFGYEDCNNSLYLNREQNNILTNELLITNKLRIYCKATVVAKYGINNDILSIKTDDKIEDDVGTETKSEFISCKSDSFVWNIDDALLLKQITTKFPSNCGLNSDPFELHEHEWYISMQAVKPNRYLSSPSSSVDHVNHKKIKISIDGLGFGSRESMDCKVSICILENGLKSTFYQKFPGRYFRDKEDTFLEVNVLSLLLLKKVSIKIDIAIVNHKHDESLTLKESKQEKIKVLNENVKSWLCETVKMAQYCDVFKTNNINSMEIVKMITKDDMKYIGVNKVGDRIRLFHEIQLLLTDNDDDDVENAKQSTSRKRKQDTNCNGYSEPPSKKARLSLCEPNGH